MTPRTPWSRAVTALGALAVTTLTTNCAGQSTPSPTMADERRADTVTVPASTWTPTPIDVLADMPSAAAQRTPAGAEAYVRYYFDTLNHLSMNPQTGQIIKLCLPDVMACTAPESGFASDLKRGFHMEDAAHQFLDCKGTIVDDNDADTAIVDAVTIGMPRTVLDDSHSTRAVATSQVRFWSHFTIVWKQNRWFISEHTAENAPHSTSSS
ncbi:MAG: hypothetical protein ABI746_06080 [Dermatophilaceae bacterium]